MKSEPTIRSALAAIREEIRACEGLAAGITIPTYPREDLSAEDWWGEVYRLEFAEEALCWVLGEHFAGLKRLSLGESCEKVDGPPDQSAN